MYSIDNTNNQLLDHSINKYIADIYKNKKSVSIVFFGNMSFIINRTISCINDNKYEQKAIKNVCKKYYNVESIYLKF